MRLPPTAHTDRPWRIHALTPDFVLEDVWALPTPGGPDELSRLIEAIFGGEFPREAPRLVGWLWEARWKLGAFRHWEDSAHGLSGRVPSLRGRLSADEHFVSGDPGVDLAPFALVYLLREEFAAEMANRTVHAVMHLGWVPDGVGGYRGQMAVLVKPNGRLGSLYMKGIKPFRRWPVYPALLAYVGARWQSTSPAQPGDTSAPDSAHV